MNSPLLPLLERLKQCPARDNTISEQRLRETWNCVKRLSPEHGDAITPAIVVGVMLHDPETFSALLSESERAQLTALGKTALERYLQLTNPPNKLGKLITGCLKPESI